jgi:hypothetical protein
MKKILIIVSLSLLILSALIVIRYYPILGEDGIFDSVYHQQSILAPDGAPFSDDWSPKEPYLCRVMKDATNPNNPFTHCSLKKYLGEWLFFPSLMIEKKANEK